MLCSSFWLTPKAEKLKAARRMFCGALKFIKYIKIFNRIGVQQLASVELVVGQRPGVWQIIHHVNYSNHFANCQSLLSPPPPHTHVGCVLFHSIALVFMAWHVRCRCCHPPPAYLQLWLRLHVYLSGNVYLCPCMRVCCVFYFTFSLYILNCNHIILHHISYSMLLLLLLPEKRKTHIR